MTERSPKPLTASIQRCSLTNMLKVNLFVRWIFFRNDRTKMSAATLPNHVVNLRRFHWLPVKCIEMSSILLWSLSKIIVVEDHNVVWVICCVGSILSEIVGKNPVTRSVSLIPALRFFTLQEDIHYNVVKIWCKSGRRRTVRNPMVGADFAGVWHFLIQIM